MGGGEFLRESVREKVARPPVESKRIPLLEWDFCHSAAVGGDHNLKMREAVLKGKDHIPLLFEVCFKTVKRRARVGINPIVFRAVPSIEFVKMRYPGSVVYGLIPFNTDGPHDRRGVHMDITKRREKGKVERITYRQIGFGNILKFCIKPDVFVRRLICLTLNDRPVVVIDAECGAVCYSTDVSLYIQNLFPPVNYLKLRFGAVFGLSRSEGL